MAKCAIAIGQYKYVLRSGPEGCGGLMIRMPRPTSLNLSLARGGVDSETCLSHGMNSHPSSTARATEAGIGMGALARNCALRRGGVRQGTLSPSFMCAAQCWGNLVP